MRKALPTLVMLLIAFCAVQTGATALGNKINTELTNWMQRVCQYEDSANCFWDAGTGGNGLGHSFYTHKINGDLCVMYVEHGYAKRHDWCLSTIDYDARQLALVDMDGDGGGAEAR